MSRRQLLGSAVIVLLTILVISFIWILFSGINTVDMNAYSESAKSRHKLFKDLDEGQVVLRHYRGNTVWVLSLSEKQKAQAQELSTYIMSDTTACDASNDFCVLFAATQRSGINTHYTLQAPAQLAVGKPWYGGFVDPTNGTVFDFLGRVYKEQKNQKSMNSVEVK